MVLRFPTALMSIILGMICCIFALIIQPSDYSVETLTDKSNLPILIIDPGHGGEDGGAVSVDGIRESDINLSISLKLNSISHLYGVTTVMTRTSDSIVYPTDAITVRERKTADQKMRLGLIQDYPNAILYSIHQNYYPSTIPSGIQVLYGHNENSKQIGNLLHQNLTAALCPQNRRVAMEIDQSIYLMKHCECTAVLIECGFLSNPDEATLLQSDMYQKKLSAIMLSVYLEYGNLCRSE